MNYTESTNYLKIAAGRGSRLGLERISELCALLGDPQDKVRIIHIAGTNGKGSFSAMLSQILKAAGYKVGSFSSPALTGVNDSFRIDCREISDDSFAKVMSEVVPVCESMDDKPTEFEVLTAAAYKLFCDENCDIAIVECGMGGDTDSTNVVKSPVLSVITNVALDHMSFLGNTVGEIASHKAGIIKSDRPILYGGNDSDAFDVIANAVIEKNAHLTVTDTSRISDVKTGISGTSFVFDGFGKVTVPLSGTYQVINTANVLTAVEILRHEGLDIPENAVLSGLASAKWHGRFELMHTDPTVIFDGAHNPDGIAQAAESIKRCLGGGKVVMLIGVMADKDYALYPEMLGQFIDCVFTVKPDNPRALDCEKLAEVFSGKSITATACPDLADGVKSAYNCAKSRNLPMLALGSLYMYNQFSTALYSIIKKDC